MRVFLGRMIEFSMGSCQNYGPFLGTLIIRCRTILKTPKGTIILTTTHMGKGSGPRFRA